MPFRLEGDLAGIHPTTPRTHILVRSPEVMAGGSEKYWRTLCRNYPAGTRNARSRGFSRETGFLGALTAGRPMPVRKRRQKLSWWSKVRKAKVLQNLWRRCCNEP